MLTSKERIDRILRHAPIDRIGLFEVFWRETVQAWANAQHLPCAETVADHFALDLRRTGGEITPGTWRLVNLVANLDAGDELVEETETARLVRDGNGAVRRWRKDGSGAPEHVSFLVKDRASWEEHIRPHLLPAGDDLRRLDCMHYRETRNRCAADQLFLSAAVVAAFDTMNDLCGHECLLMAMATDPEWVRDMCDVYTTLTIQLLETLFAQEGLPDALWVWDDLGYKHRPFMSPAMYRALVFPAHHRLFEFAHRWKLPVILHSDGLIDSLLPHLIEAGIDCLQPLEAKAGMDLLRVKKQYGERIALIGGMDARELISNDRERVRRELERKIPAAMDGGGYILQVDHSVPHQVHYDTYKYFVETGLQLGTY